jgi:hypothetical protein
MLSARYFSLSVFVAVLSIAAWLAVSPVAAFAEGEWGS